MAIKTVTCSFYTIKQAADLHGIQLSMACSGRSDWVSNPEADVILRRVRQGEVAVQGRTLAGDLFLSLLVTGAIG